MHSSENLNGQICNNQNQELLQDLLALRDAGLGNRNHPKVGREWWQWVSSISTLAHQRAAKHTKMMRHSFLPVICATCGSVASGIAAHPLVTPQSSSLRLVKWYLHSRSGWRRLCSTVTQRTSNRLMEQQIRMERGILLLPRSQTVLEHYHNLGATTILVLVSLLVKKSD